MEILVIGLILLILGIGATIIYDNHKDKIIATIKDIMSKGLPQRRSPKNYTNSSAYQASRTAFQDAEKEILRQRKEVQAAIKNARKQLEQAQVKPKRKKKIVSKITAGPTTGSFTEVKETIYEDED